MVTEVENEYAKFWFENGILMSQFKRKIIFSREIVIELIELRQQISNNKYQCWCMDCTNILSMTNEARDYASKHGQELLYGCTAIINSHLGKALFNSYNKFYPPKIPFVFFTKKEKAVEWLLTFKQGQELEIA